MWKVFVFENGKKKLIYNKQWTPTCDDMSVVHKVRGKKYQVVSPKGEDVTKFFPYGIET